MSHIKKLFVVSALAQLVSLWSGDEDLQVQLPLFKNNYLLLHYNKLQPLPVDNPDTVQHITTSLTDGVGLWETITAALWHSKEFYTDTNWSHFLLFPFSLPGKTVRLQAIKPPVWQPVYSHLAFLRSSKQCFSPLLENWSYETNLPQHPCWSLPLFNSNFSAAEHLWLDQITTALDYGHHFQSGVWHCSVNVTP